MAALLLSILLVGAPTKTYQKDVDFALKALEKDCGHFFKLKGIRWAKVGRQFRAEAIKVKTDEQHWILLWRLICRLKDGHANVLLTDKTKGLKWPVKADEGPGVSFTSPDGGKTFYIFRVADNADRNGVKPGMQVLEVDGKPVGRWIKERMAGCADMVPLYTPHQALDFTCTWGLGGPRNSRRKLQMKGKRITLTCEPKQWTARGPVFPPKGLKAMGRTYYTTLPGNIAYVWLTKVENDQPQKMDTILGVLGAVKGVILDFRSNGGGGTNHDQFMGCFVPKGKTITFGKRYASWGKNPYIGPVVVIVDATTKSSGETLSGIFKEDGRGYMIGPSPTAGMSSSKKTIELPSGLFKLYVSVASNKGRFNRGKGVEGIGVPPNEIVPYDPKDLAEGVDTCIKRAVELLKKMPKRVPYKPERYGWKK